MIFLWNIHVSFKFFHCGMCVLLFMVDAQHLATWTLGFLDKTTSRTPWIFVAPWKEGPNSVSVQEIRNFTCHSKSIQRECSWNHAGVGVSPIKTGDGKSMLPTCPGLLTDDNNWMSHNILIIFCSLVNVWISLGISAIFKTLQNSRLYLSGMLGDVTIPSNGRNPHLKALFAKD